MDTSEPSRDSQAYVTFITRPSPGPRYQRATPGIAWLLPPPRYRQLSYLNLVLVAPSFVQIPRRYLERAKGPGGPLKNGPTRRALCLVRPKPTRSLRGRATARLGLAHCIERRMPVRPSEGRSDNLEGSHETPSRTLRGAQASPVMLTPRQGRIHGIMLLHRARVVHPAQARRQWSVRRPALRPCRHIMNVTDDHDADR